MMYDYRNAWVDCPFSFEEVATLSTATDSCVNAYNPAEPKPEPLYPKDLKTQLLLNGGNVKVSSYKDGHHRGDFKLMSGVSDVKIIYDKEKNPKGVIVEFYDGTKQKAVCDNDEMSAFNLWSALSICLFKKYLDENVGNGSNVYHKLVSYAIMVMKDIEMRKIADEELKKAEHEARMASRKAEADRKHAEREREIEIQKEAYLRAMREFEKEKGVAVD